MVEPHPVPVLTPSRHRASVRVATWLSAVPGLGQLYNRQPKKALEFLDRLLRDGEEPLPMLGAMTWMYRKLIEASEVKGVTNGWQAARALGMRPEQAELALQNARKISKPRLLAGLHALRSADDRLKGSGAEPRTVMEFLVAQLTGEEAKAARG